MAVYTYLDETALRAVVETAYDIGVFRSGTGIAEGVENSNYLIETEDTRTILTLFEKRVAAEELPFFMGVMTHFHGRGIACPLPIMRRDGCYIGEVAGKPAAMVSFLVGKSVMQPGVAECAAMGAFTARLHQAAEGCPGARANALSVHGWEQIFSTIGSRLDAIRAGLAMDVAGEIAYLNRHWPRDLPRGIVHADLFPDNIFFGGRGSAAPHPPHFVDAPLAHLASPELSTDCAPPENTISGVIDFYFACEDFFAYDLAIVINAWCFDGAELNAEKHRAMMTAYEAVRPLSSSERAAMPVLLRGAALRFLLTRAHDWVFHDAAALVTPKDPMEYVGKLGWWRNSMSE